MAKKRVTRFVMLEGVSQEERIKDALEKLDLDEVWESLREVNKRANTQKMTYFDFLDTLLEKAFNLKEERRQPRWTSQARFPAEKKLESFNFDEPNLEIDQQLINELASCRYIDEAKNIVIFGPTGVGKTHIAIGLGYKAIDMGKDVRFYTLKELLDTVKKKIESGDNMHIFMNNLTRPRLLIIDDMENIETSEEISLFLLSLIEQRYEVNPIIFTSNEAFHKFDKLFGGPKRAGKIIDRIFHHVERVIIKGDSYRTKGKMQYTS